MELYMNNKYLETVIAKEINNYIETRLSLHESDYYLLQNGKRTSIENVTDNFKVHIILRQLGGKGGFGSMLRAIGAQIEKTTNREACRDLSGRRLRDINEEKRLKAWIDSQNTREQEAADRKQKKLERLCERPRHEFKDEVYDKERSALPERLEDAVSQGLAAASGEGVKRKGEAVEKVVKKKKKALWVDDGISSCSDSEEEENGKDAGPSSDTGVESKSEDETSNDKESKKSDATNDSSSDCPQEKSEVNETTDEILECKN